MLVGPEGVRVRPRTAADREACVALATEVHRVDGYPRYLRGEIAAFVTPSYENAAWVAELAGQVVGHVALHDARLDPTLAAARRATGLPAEELAVVARLMVAPGARRQGIARALIEEATSHARSRGQRAVLDVVQDSAPAIAVYESLGWTRIEALTLTFDRTVLELWVYLSP